MCFFYQCSMRSFGQDWETGAYLVALLVMHNLGAFFHLMIEVCVLCAHRARVHNVVNLKRSQVVK